MNIGTTPRTRTVVAGVVVSALIALGIAVGTGQDADARVDTTATTSSGASTGSASGGGSAGDGSAVTGSASATGSDATGEPSTVSIDSDAIDEAIDALGGQVSVALLNLDTGDSYSSDNTTYDTASIVKVDILAALLHQQDGELSDAQKTLATAMIERSDNASATALLEAVGGEAGLDAVNEVFGLTSTTIGADGLWGLTQTTAADQVRLLEVVFGEDSVLSSDAQDYVASLMEDVIDSQHFGVSAAADAPEDAALKVGYLQRSATGLWDVTSIGRIEVDGQTYLVAVLSDSSASFAAGQSLVESAAQAAVERAASDLSSKASTA